MPQLTLSVTVPSGTYDLAALGPLDFFVYPGSTTMTRKTAANLLSVAHIGTFTDTLYANSGTSLTWSGGTPTASGTTTGGIYGISGSTLPVGSGFSVTAPADPTVRILRIFAGAFSGTLKVDVSLSDASSPAQANSSTVTTSATSKYAFIEVQYAAASASQTVTVLLTRSAAIGNGNVSISGAALAAAPTGGGSTAPDAPTSVVATAGTGSVSVAITPGGDGGSAITSYVANIYSVSNNALLGSNSSASSPVVVSGISAVPVYAKATVSNAVGTSPESAASNQVTPAATPQPVVAALNDAALYWSPATWDDYGTYKQAIAAGSYLKTVFSGVTSISVDVDLSVIAASGLAANLYPIIRTVIDGYIFVDTQLTSSTTQVTRSGLSTGTHTFEFYIRSIDTDMPRWTSPSGVRVKSVTIPAGGSFTAPSLRSKRMEYHGDSITEGWLQAGPTNNNALHTAVPMIAQAFDAEYGQLGFSGQGYDQAGGSRPAFRTSALFYSSGRDRRINGLLSPMPDYICVEHGTNGTTTQAHVLEVIDAFRAAAPNARIFMMVPANGRARSPVTAAVNARSSDTKLHLIDLGTAYQAGIAGSGTTGASNMYAADALHRNLLSNAMVATGYATDMQAAIDNTVAAPAPTLFTRTVSITMGDANGPAANLSGIEVSFFDEATPRNHTVARFKTANETTDANGLMTFTVQSTLAVGGQGSIDVLLPDGRNLFRTVTVS